MKVIISKEYINMDDYDSADPNSWESVLNELKVKHQIIDYKDGEFEHLTYGFHPDGYNSPILVFGTIEFIKHLIEYYEQDNLWDSNFIWFNSDTFKCSSYYPIVGGKNLVNYPYMMLPKEILVDLPWSYKSFPITKCLGQLCAMDSSIFIRPDNYDKPFVGGHYQLTSEFGWRKMMERVEKVSDDSLCLIANKKTILREFRFLIGFGKVIDGCMYDKNIFWKNGNDDESFESAKQVAIQMANMEWQPSEVYVCDVAEFIDGDVVNEKLHGQKQKPIEFKILELNPYSTSAMYSMDKKKIIESFLKMFNNWNSNNIGEM